MLPPPGTPGDDDSPGARRRNDADGPLSGIVVPDDLAELSAEVEAYRREQRSAARRARLARVFGPARPDGAGSRPDPGNRLPSAVLIAILVLVGTLGALLPILGARTHDATLPGQVPLALTSVPAGRIGGLLPDVALRGPGGAVGARALRPGVLALLPPSCQCAADIADLVSQTHESSSLLTALIGPGGDDASVRRLAADPSAGGGQVLPLTDPSATLRALYTTTSAAGPVLLLVAADGRLLRAPRAFRHGDRLESWLSISQRATAG
jgi:hypothetical protein